MFFRWWLHIDLTERWSENVRVVDPTDTKGGIFVAIKEFHWFRNGLEACEELLIVFSNLLLSLRARVWFIALCSGNSHATLTDLDLIAIVECSHPRKKLWRRT
jgi:hypothetical protein